jgi:hypothetical protein
MYRFQSIESAGTSMIVVVDDIQVIEQAIAEDNLQ